MLYTEIASDIQNNFCTQHFLPMFCKKKTASDKDKPVLIRIIKKNTFLNIVSLLRVEDDSFFFLNRYLGEIGVRQMKKERKKDTKK